MTRRPPGAGPAASRRARRRESAGELPHDIWTHPADDPRLPLRPAVRAAAEPEPPDVWAPAPEPFDIAPPRPRVGRAAATPAPAPGGSPTGPGEPSSRMAHAAAATAGLSVAGSVLGLVRDQGIAHLFGAGAESDAFLVAWTIPEVAATVLIEDAMALLMVPAFSAALAGGQGPRALVRGTLPRLLAALALLTAALAAGAGWVVRVLAPGIADPATAAACTRLTALTVLTFGAAGYLSAALRAHRRFAAPAAIYVAYNTGIVAVLFTLHGHLGVRAAAAGVAVGGALMVAAQLPSFLKVLRSAAPTGWDGPRRRNPLGPALLAPVVVFTLSRQAQVLVERFFAAPLPAGAISHLNYAEKVAQLPMALSVMIVTVTFPVLSRALADGDREQARRRVERDLALACLVVLLGTAYVIACAPQIIDVLFQRGEFTAADTADTATVMRVYALGLLGQSLVGALVRPYFSAAGPTWYPAAAMGLGLLVTAAADAAAVGPWGAYGIAAGNALGITVTAALLLRGLGAHTVAVRLAAVAPRIGRITLAALCATGAGWVVAHHLGDPVVAVAACAVAVPAVFAGAALAVRVPEVPYLLATVTRKGRP
ncbi:murein biosynthesis integral membrane protein MurJ [Streptomyces sp. CA2R106]|uniref:murein biosynthesis integral membrane protein MurJ n=1 Tax=Streptomyces sp. CA2R106 TaxID=3120153 RepID=UPI00300BF4C0